jgi:hypothetical protein
MFISYVTLNVSLNIGDCECILVVTHGGRGMKD